MDRAFSILTVKAVEEDQRVIRGVATTPEADRHGDIVEPLGIKFNNPLPLLWQHQHDKPIGHVTFDKPTKSGITFEAKIPVVDEPGTLRERVEEAWQSVKIGLVRAVSIGFRPIEYSFMDNSGIRFTETEVYELSLVTIPANAGAVINAVKSVDAAYREALGIKDTPTEFDPARAAASGKSVRVVRLNKQAGVSAPFIIREIKRTGNVQVR